jgi:hypothetical protein
MSVKEHVFDPQGDVVFKLFRYPEDEEEEELASDASSSAGSHASTGSLHDDAGPLEVFDVPVLETNNENDLGIPKEDTPYLEVPRWSERKPSTSEVHMRVSSRHMILASRNFRDMLSNGNFEEGQTLRTKGEVEIPLPEDDPDAFIILLHIIHANTRKVPRVVSLATLTALAILVDKYNMLEAVELFSDLWIDNVKDEEPMPESFTDDVPPWLVISWVFQKPEEFKAMSRIIEQECDETLEDMFGDDLPVVPFIIGR